ncbi:uncharacterized protein LOC130747006 [Lotus japonicus]|uniref:uncharacterized protein LOC130747006 n=1 Tax=Lotus japonicus TaxID=34305 RepID=UPI00258AAD40|nr:uncharacterized protein LOC130747006 [Lotus japonicus]
MDADALSRFHEFRPVFLMNADALSRFHEFRPVNNVRGRFTMEIHGQILGLKPETDEHQEDSFENLERFIIDANTVKEYSECSVCLGELSIGSKAIQLPKPCSHVYHQHCIIQWLNNSRTCPLCRRTI